MIAPLSKTPVKTYAESLEFCKKTKMNEDFCILIDMEIHSGKKRFLIWDFKIIDPMLQKASKPVLMWIFDDRTNQVK